MIQCHEKAIQFRRFIFKPIWLPIWKSKISALTSPDKNKEDFYFIILFWGGGASHCCAYLFSPFFARARRWTAHFIFMQQWNIQWNQFRSPYHSNYSRIKNWTEFIICCRASPRRSRIIQLFRQHVRPTTRNGFGLPPRWEASMRTGLCVFDIA